MKSRLTLPSITKTIVPAIALMLSSVGATVPVQAAASIVITNATPAVTVDGTSGGTSRDASCGGFVAEVPNHTIEITEDSDRKFRVKGNSNTTLLVLNSQGKRFCVQADEFSGGEAELPGRWKKGTYRVYVGSKNQGRSNYQLTILPIN